MPSIRKAAGRSGTTPPPHPKIDFLIENPLHEQPDLSLGIEAFAEAVFPDSRQHLAVHADVELDLFRGLRDDGSRHCLPDRPRPISSFLQKPPIRSNS